MAAAHAHRPQLNKLFPPQNFATVERQLYRSGEPYTINFSFLRSLKLRTIVWLAAEDPNEQLLEFADNYEIDFEHLGMITEGANPWDQLTNQAIEKALSYVLDVRSYPLLVCCSMGRHRTGTVIGCLRKLQDWAFACIVDEYQRFAGLRGERVSVEMCIESFDIDIRPGHPPPWFRGRLSQAKQKTTNESAGAAKV